MAAPSMRKIAEAASVSTATVSMALRNSPQISEDTRQRILKIAEELGYRPNPLVSSLMTQIRTGKKATEGSTIAILGPGGTAQQLTQGYSYPRKMYQAVLKRADELGYNVEVFSADSEDSSIEQQLRVIDYRSIRGILLPPFSSGRQDLPIDFGDHDFAVVTIGYSQNVRNVNRVAHDQFRIAYGLTQECIKRGYKRIGIHMQKRFNARTGFRYTSAFMGAHFDLDKKADHAQLYIRDQYKRDDLLKWIKREKIDCLISQDPQTHQILVDEGFGIPDEIGYAAISWNEERSDISAMHHDPNEIGRVAVDMLTAHLNRNEYGQPEVPKTMLIKPEWKEGTTLRPVQK